MLPPAEQVRFVTACLAEAGVEFDSVEWKDDCPLHDFDCTAHDRGVTVKNWRGPGSDVLVGRAWELLARANGVEPYCCAECWAADRADECNAGDCTRGVWP